MLERAIGKPKIVTKGGTYTLSGDLMGQVLVNTAENIILRLAGVTIQSNTANGPVDVNVKIFRLHLGRFMVE